MPMSTSTNLAALALAVLTVGCACAQEGTPAPPPAAPPAAAPAPSDDRSPQQAVADDDVGSPGKPGAKIGLMRGVVKRMDPIHDQFVIHAFGGRDIRIAFDPRTKLLPENTRPQLSSLPLGTVVAVDTVIENGNLFARSV